MKYLIFILLLILIFIQCESITGQQDEQLYLKTDHLKGTWVQVTEVSSEIPGLYRKDTTFYEIGLDLPPFEDRYKDDIMTFYIQYKKGKKYGYIYDPQEDYDWDRQLSSLTYTMILGLPEATTQDKAIFTIPSSDSLIISIGSDIIHAHKHRGL